MSSTTKRKGEAVGEMSETRWYLLALKRAEGATKKGVPRGPCKLGKAENCLPSKLWRKILTSKLVKLISASVSTTVGAATGRSLCNHRVCLSVAT